MAELNRRRITTMLTTDTQLYIWSCLFAKFGSHLYKLSYTYLVKPCKRVGFIDLLVIIFLKELAGIVTAKPESHLCKVICTEGEEFSFFCYFISSKCSSRNFNHRSHHIFKFHACFCNYFISCLYTDI